MIAVETDPDLVTPWLWDNVNHQLAGWWPRLFGYHLISVGPWSQSLSFAGSPIRHQCLIMPNGQINAQAEALPLVESSVDVVVLPFTLHLSSDPHQVMREAYRVLIAGGHLVLIQPNPVSLAAIGAIVGSRRKHPLWAGRWLTPWRVHDWLSLLAYDVRHRERLCFGSLLGSQPPHGRWEDFASRHLNWLGGVEVIVACKRETPLTAIRLPQKRSKRVATPALAPQVRSR